MHDSRFDDELKNRLGDYTEEPDDALWQGIAAGISSTPAGMGWLGWVAKSVVASVVVMSVVGDVKFELQGSEFQVQGAAVEDRLALEDSKFNIQNSKSEISSSKLNADEVDIYAEALRGNAGWVHSPPAFAGGQLQRAQQCAADGNAVECPDELDDQSLALNAQSSKLNTGVGRLENKDQRSENKDQRSKPEERGSGFEVQTEALSTPTSKTGARISKGRSSAEGITRRELMAESDPRGDVTTADTGVKSVGTGAVGSSDVPAGNSKSKTPDSKSDMAEGDSSGKGDSGVGGIEDTGIVNFAGPPRPVNGDAVVEVKSFRVDSVQAAKVEKEKVKEVREEQRREDKPRREPGPLSAYFTAMPTLGYQKLEANPADNVIVESFEKLSNFSSKRLGVRAEIGVEYKLTPRVRAFGGLLYYQRKQTISYTERVNTGVKETVWGDTLTLDPQFAVEDRSFEYELKNVGVQLGLNYTLWNKKFLHVAGTGIEFHKALNKLTEDQRALGFTTHPSTYVFYNLYYRVQYPAEGRLKAIFQPTFNYALFLNRDMNAPFYVKPYGLGLNLGLTYSF